MPSRYFPREVQMLLDRIYATDGTGKLTLNIKDGFIKGVDWAESFQVDVPVQDSYAPSK